MKWREAKALGLKRCCATGKRQCKKVAIAGTSFCKQHQYMKDQITMYTQYGGTGHLDEEDEEDEDS